MNANDFRRIALSLQGAKESSHMRKPAGWAAESLPRSPQKSWAAMRNCPSILLHALNAKKVKKNGITMQRVVDFILELKKLKG